MHIVLDILLALAMLGVFVTLFAGLFGLVRGGGDPKRSNRLMRYRVLFQGIAILLFAIALGLGR